MKKDKLIAFFGSQYDESHTESTVLPHCPPDIKPIGRISESDERDEFEKRPTKEEFECKLYENRNKYYWIHSKNLEGSKDLKRSQNLFGMLTVGNGFPLIYEKIGNKFDYTGNKTIP